MWETAEQRPHSGHQNWLEEKGIAPAAVREFCLPVPRLQSTNILSLSSSTEALCKTACSNSVHLRTTENKVSLFLGAHALSHSGAHFCSGPLWCPAASFSLWLATHSGLCQGLSWALLSIRRPVTTNLMQSTEDSYIKAEVLEQRSCVHMALHFTCLCGFQGWKWVLR